MLNIHVQNYLERPDIIYIYRDKSIRNVVELLPGWIIPRLFFLTFVPLFIYKGTKVIASLTLIITMINL